jgi:hypothetical protein
MRTDTAFQLPASVHPAERELQTFLTGALPPPEAAPIVRHLLKGCPQCLKVTRPIVELMMQKPKRRGGRL